MRISEEILEVGGTRYTRVYAGGTVDDVILTQLGITKDDVMNFLKSVLLEAGGKTRFDLPYEKADGLWQYSYSPGKQDAITGMFLGEELIYYKNTEVFVHYFIISRVSE